MNSSTSTILIGLDFSDCSLHALDYGINLSKKFQSKIHIFYTIESTGGALTELLTHKKKVEIAGIYSKKLKEVLSSYELNIGDIELIIKEGKFHKELEKYADHIKPDLVCIGINSAHKINSKHIGSNVLKLVSNINEPVLLVNDKMPEKPFENILLSLDLSKDIHVPTLIKHFKHFNKCIVRIVCVAGNVDDFELNKLTRQLTIVKNDLSKHNILNSGEIIRLTKTNDKISEVILDYEEKVEADAVAIVVRKHHQVKDFMSGANYLDICNNTKLPVMSLSI